MAFIETMPESEIDDDVRAMYEREEAHYGFVPNYAKVFCHRPRDHAPMGAAAAWYQAPYG